VKNDVSHHGILLNQIFAQFCRIFREKPDSGSGKSDTRFRNLFVLKHIWVKVSIIWNFQPNWSKNTLKSGFFWISGKSGSWIRNFFGLKPSRDQDGAKKKKFSQIGPAVPEEIGNIQASKQTSCCYIKEIASFCNLLKFSNLRKVPIRTKWNMLSLNIISIYQQWIIYFYILFVITNIHKQGLEQKKKNKDFILNLNKKTNF